MKSSREGRRVFCFESNVEKERKTGVLSVTFFFDGSVVVNPDDIDFSSSSSLGQLFRGARSFKAGSARLVR